LQHWAWLDYLHGRTPDVPPPVLGPIVAWLVEHRVYLGSSDAPATHALVVDADSERRGSRRSRSPAASSASNPWGRTRSHDHGWPHPAPDRRRRVEAAITRCPTHLLTSSRGARGPVGVGAPTGQRGRDQGEPRGFPRARGVRDERRADGGRRLAACDAAATRAAVGGCESETGMAFGGLLSPQLVPRWWRIALSAIWLTIVVLFGAGLQRKPHKMASRPERPQP
jgi:hypothetical protein